MRPLNGLDMSMTCEHGGSSNQILTQINDATAQAEQHSTQNLDDMVKQVLC